MSNKQKDLTTKETEANHNEHKINYFGYWKCYKFQKDLRYNENFNKNYAKEFSTYSYFSIYKDTLISPSNQKFNYYDYSYSTKLKKYNIESTFITYLKPKQESLLFLTISDNDISNLDTPFKILFFYNNEMIIHDRGFFFFYKKSEILNDVNIKGTPGDNRNIWNVNMKFHGSGIEEAYGFFKTQFSFGSENLLDKLPQANYFDKQNDITYDLLNVNHLKIIKNNSQGTITIEFIIKDSFVELIYKFEYLENG